MMARRRPRSRSSVRSAVRQQRTWASCETVRVRGWSFESASSRVSQSRCSDISASNDASSTFLVSPVNRPRGPTSSTPSRWTRSTTSSASCRSSGDSGRGEGDSHGVLSVLVEGLSLVGCHVCRYGGAWLQPVDFSIPYARTQTTAKGQDRMKTCEACDDPIDGTTRRRYCSTACRSLPHRARQQRRPSVGAAPGAVREAVAGWIDSLGLPGGDARVTVAVELARQVDADPGSSGM